MHSVHCTVTNKWRNILFPLLSHLVCDVCLEIDEIILLLNDARLATAETYSLVRAIQDIFRIQQILQCKEVNEYVSAPMEGQLTNMLEVRHLLGYSCISILSVIWINLRGSLRSRSVCKSTCIVSRFSCASLRTVSMSPTARPMRRFINKMGIKIMKITRKSIEVNS